MFINIVIALLAVAFITAAYFQNALYSSDMPLEKRDVVTTSLSLISPLLLVVDSYLLAKKTELFFDRPWIDLCILYYMIGFVAIQMAFAVWGRWKMNKYHEMKKTSKS